MDLQDQIDVCQNKIVTNLQVLSSNKCTDTIKTRQIINSNLLRLKYRLEEEEENAC